MATFACPTNATENSATLPSDQRSISYRLFRHYKSRPVGRNIYIYSDDTVSENDPDGYSTLWKESDRMGDTLANAPHVVSVFWGGHDAVDITSAQATLLTNAGYTVT